MLCTLTTLHAPLILTNSLMIWQPFDPVSYFAHIAVGFIAYAAGLTALATKKGSTWHIRSGRVFALTIAIPIVTTVVFQFTRFFPLAVVLTVASLYLTASGYLALQSKKQYAVVLHRILTVFPILLFVGTGLRFIQSLSLSLELIPGPLLMTMIFGTLAWGDIQVLRAWPTEKSQWIRRHLHRMLLSFGFATMAVLRIGIGSALGVTLELTVVLPLVAALLAIMYFRRRVPELS